MGKARGSYLVRVFDVVRNNPREVTERIRGRAEIKLARLRQHRTRYAAREDWELLLHQSIAAPWPCPARERFDEIWSQVSAGPGHDADVGLARAAWCSTLHLQPAYAVETGVARGVTSNLILSALQELGRGHLYSIDLPPIFRGWQGKSGELVDDKLRSRWTYLRGSSRRHLPRLLRQLGSIDLFLHDSLHTPPTMRFEISRAWERLRPGGILLVDDVHENEAFARFTGREDDVDQWAVAPKEVRGGSFAFAVKKK